MLVQRFLLSEHEEPWTEEQVIKAVAFDFQKARRDIDGTVGARIWAALGEVKDSHWILDHAIDDLLEGINRFSHRSQYQDFWLRINEDERDEYTRNMKRNLFNASSALTALVDHTRNFSRAYPVPYIAEMRRKIFGEDNLHRFLFDLRNYSVHWRPAQANWNISVAAGEAGVSRTVQFLLSKSTLLEWNGWKSDAIEFLKSRPEKFDVRELFVEYQSRAREFQSWLQSAATFSHYPHLRQFFEYKRWHERFLDSCEWNAAVAFRGMTKEPYELLQDYLTPRAIEVIYSYDLKSDEQIDRIVALVDLYDAVDDSLRAKLHDFLRQAPHSSSGEETV
ncbi:hypothetical protein [Synechococcus sp. BO 8801]|uniref:hypothetical protein n=1 Tax=Synechococcus sp. BO 8801 TaxID=169670 RepID=UPI0011815694|nr:hypothetical protein [Synechococcus sp. BO 8801]